MTRSPCRFRVFLLSAVMLGVSSAAWAQVPTLSTGVLDSELSAAGDQNRLYAEIAAEAAAVEQQGNLLRKIVKLVKPSVVHLESLKSEGGQATPSTTGALTIEEAGSG